MEIQTFDQQNVANPDLSKRLSLSRKVCNLETEENMSKTTEIMVVIVQKIVQVKWFSDWWVSDRITFQGEKHKIVLSTWKSKIWEL